MENESANLKLTVILRIHGRNQYYKSAINSVLNQEYDVPSIEIIVVTNLREVSEYLLNFSDLNVYIYLYKEATEGEALWEGIKKSSGDIICFLDDDDLWKKNRLQIIKNVFGKFQELGYYHNAVVPFTDSSMHLKRKQYEVIGHKEALYVPNSGKQSLIKKVMGYYPDFNMSSICIRKNIISKKMEQWREITTSPDTFLFFCALESNSDLLLDTRELTLYRHHDLNLTRNSTTNEWNHKILESHCGILKIFSGTGNYIEKLALRRLMLTKIQISLRTNSSSKKQAISYSLAYLKILFSFCIPVDALVLSLLVLSIFQHEFAQKIYLRFV